MQHTAGLDNFAFFNLSQIDWYCCTCGSYHISHALDPSLSVTENEAVRNWLLVEDDVFCRQVAKAVGNDGISKLVASYKASGDNYEAANAQWTTATTVYSRGSGRMEAPLHEILLLLEQSIESGRDFSSVQQLAYDANGELVHSVPVSQSHFFAP